MSSALNLEQMKADEMDYITRLSSSKLQSIVKELPNESQPELWDRNELIELEIDGTRYVVAGSEFRRYRDSERRNARIAKGMLALTKIASNNRKKVDVQKISSQIGRKLLALNAHKYFQYRFNQKGILEWSLKANVIEQESHIDGWYLLSTSISQK